MGKYWDSQSGSTLVGLYLVFLSIHIAASVFASTPDVEEHLFGKTVYKVFENPTKQFIILNCFCCIATAIPSTNDLILDMWFNWDSEINDRPERVLILLLQYIPSILLVAFPPQVNLAMLFIVSHSYQICGCLCATLSLCHRLIPNYFTLKKCYTMQVFMGLTGFLSIAGIGRPLSYWVNILPFIFSTITSFIFYDTFNVWMSKENLIGKLRKGVKLSPREIYCSLYLFSYSCYFTIVFVNTCLSNFNWAEQTEVNCLVCMTAFKQYL